MGDGTEIGWTDASWNCLRGCSRTIAAGASTSGCGDPTGGGCYAERNGYRFAGPGLPYEGLVRLTKNGPRWTGKVLLVDKHLLDPIRWDRPRKIFTTSVSDPFHEQFSFETIAIVVGVMAATRRHTHQMLTKRTRRAREWFAWVAREAAAANGGRGMSPAAYCFCLLQKYVRDLTRFTEADSKLLSRSDVVDAAMSAPWPLDNLWPGASVEHQPAANDRVPDLLEIPATLHWLSIEPLIGPIVIPRHDQSMGPSYSPVGWIVTGCESGSGARPCDVAWLRSLRDQCAAAGVPFFLKQAREALAPIRSDGSHEDEPPYIVSPGLGSRRKPGGVIELPYLDGVQHAAFPEVHHGCAAIPPGASR